MLDARGRYLSTTTRMDGDNAGTRLRQGCLWRMTELTAVGTAARTSAKRSSRNKQKRFIYHGKSDATVRRAIVRHASVQPRAILIRELSKINEHIYSRLIVVISD